MILSFRNAYTCFVAYMQVGKWVEILEEEFAKVAQSLHLLHERSRMQHICPPMRSCVPPHTSHHPCAPPQLPATLTKTLDDPFFMGGHYLMLRKEMQDVLEVCAYI